jgi:phosphoserine aminotransferase
MTNATVTRIFNFAAGPAVMPLPVLEEARRDLVALPGIGMSVLEMSHRSKAFEDIMHNAMDGMRELAGIPSNYKIMFLQGGASLQFSMVPLNLMSPGAAADYIDTGSWADKAIKEAKRVGKVNVAATTRPDNYSRIPGSGEMKFTPGAAYVHMTSNNTIEGTQWKSPPDTGAAPLVSDASSDIFSHPPDVARHGLIYAGAQKNLGPSGVTVVIIREDLLERSQDNLHTMLSYRIQSENDSLYNTPNTFGIYLLGLTMKWLKSLGGLAEIAKINERRRQSYMRKSIGAGSIGERRRRKAGP